MEASLSGRRKTNEARANAVPTVISLDAAMFVLPLVLLALPPLCPVCSTRPI